MLCVKHLAVPCTRGAWIDLAMTADVSEHMCMNEHVPHTCSLDVPPVQGPVQKGPQKTFHKD